MKENQLIMLIGKRISLERKRRKLSQEELAFRSGIDKTFISRIERGTTNLSIKTLYKLTRVFKIKLSNLFKQS